MANLRNLSQVFLSRALFMALSPDCLLGVAELIALVLS